MSWHLDSGNNSSIGPVVESAQGSVPTPEHAAWQRVVAGARNNSTFDQWFSSVQFDDLSGGILRLTARDEFVREWVAQHFLPQLLSGLEVLLGSRIEVQWQISGQLDRPVSVLATPNEARRPGRLRIDERSTMPSEARNTVATGAYPSHRTPFDSDADLDSRRPPAMGARPGQAQAPRSTRPAAPPYLASRTTLQNLNDKYTFRNFVVGPSNELAYAAAVASAGGGGPRYNPLFICGPTGLGKTHLMHSIAHRVLEDRPDACVLYVSAEHFTNQFIEALQHHKMEEFRHRYRSECDLLLLDDIQFLAGREQTQEEFFHTFNALHDADKPIIVSSDKYPQDLQRMPERLISRFNSGLVADIQTPALETRVAIVRKKAALEGINISDDVAVLLAQSVKSNVRELEGSLIRLAAKSSLMGRPIDIDFARGEIAVVASRQPDIRSVEDIQKAVCGHFCLTNADLLSKDRHKSVAFARQVAMYLCRQRLKCSFPELGRAFGNRDHTTVMSAVRRVESLRQTDPQVNAHLHALESKLSTEGD